MPTQSDVQPRGELATRADFHIGSLRVSPSAGRVRIGGREERVEPRVLEVLIVLWENAGQSVSRDRLVDLCWDGRVVSDDAVNRIIAKVRKLSRLDDPAPFTLETLPKIGFRLIPLADGELAANNRQAPSVLGAIGQKVSSRISTGGYLALSAVAAVILFIVATLLFTNQSASATEDGWIEVTPMQATSDDPQVVRIAKRVDETILRFLPSLGVKSADIAASGAASPSAAEFRIAGVIDQQGETFLATGQIIEPRSGLILWSGEYERAASEPDGLEEAFSSFVTGVLACAMDQRAHGNVRITTRTFAQLLNVCEAVVFQRRDGLEPARHLLRAAPHLAAAHALLSGAELNDLDSRSPGDAELNAALDSAKALAERAVEIAPVQPIAHLSLARVALYRQDFAEAERQFKQAIAIDPDLTPTVLFYASFLQDMGRTREARDIYERVSRMSDPRLVGFGPPLVYLQAIAGDEAAARETIKRVARINPEYRRPLTDIVDFWWATPPTAPGERVEGEPPFLVARRACFQDVLKRLAATHQGDGLPSACDQQDMMTKLRLLSRLGDVDAAYVAYESMPANERRYSSPFFYPEMAAFRSDPRFAELAETLGLVHYWRETGNWPDYCRQPAPARSCELIRSR